jgi:hypothetical protein
MVKEILSLVREQNKILAKLEAGAIEAPRPRGIADELSDELRRAQRFEKPMPNAVASSAESTKTMPMRARPSAKSTETK